MADMMNNNTAPSLEQVHYHVALNPAATKAAGHPVYTGVVDIKETYNTADVAERMVSEGCAVKAATIRLVLSEFAELVGKLAGEGRAINIGGLVRFAPAVRGVFETEDAPWDAAKHTLVVNASAGSRIRSAAALSAVQRVNGVVFPTLTRLVDLATFKDDTITSRGDIFVFGTKLTWDDTQKDEGFFVNYLGVESRCQMLESVQDPTCAALRTTQPYATDGDLVELFFRTRMGGTTLRQFKYPRRIDSATEKEDEAGTTENTENP